MFTLICFEWKVAMLKEVKLLSHVIKRNVEFGFIIEHMCVCVYIKNCLECYMKCFKMKIYFSHVSDLAECVKCFDLLNNCFCSYLVLLLPTLPGLQIDGLVPVRNDGLGSGLNFLLLSKKLSLETKVMASFWSERFWNWSWRGCYWRSLCRWRLKCFFIFQNRISDFCFTSGFIFCFTILLLLPVKSTHLSGFGNDFL